MENKKQLGGKRRGAGRKPVLSKKKQISLYVEGVKIIKFGNEEKMKQHLYEVIDGFGNEELKITPPLSELPQFDVKAMNNGLAQSSPMFEQPKSTITGLPPKLTLFSDFINELNKATTIPQVEEIMKRAKGEVFTPRDKMALEAKAKEVSKEMFND